MQVSVSDVALESSGHKRKSSLPFAKSAKGRAPSFYCSREKYDGGILSLRMLGRNHNSEGRMRHPPAGP